MRAHEAREAVIAGLPLYSPKLHRGFLAVASFIQGVRRSPIWRGPVEAQRNAQAGTFRLVHEYLHHLA